MTLDKYATVSKFGNIALNSENHSKLNQPRIIFRRGSKKTYLL